MEDSVVQFLRKKDYKQVRYIDRGGLGQTRLLFDDIINEHFVCKKYSPIYPEHQGKYFKNFIDEIKLLHLAYHKNVVRVFNYYLYPEKLTGYILMEYVDGMTIDKYCQIKPEEIDTLFEQTINAFKHLEEINVLHRDIRPANIMVTESGVVKVIDFGFGKKIDFSQSDFENSIGSINWYYSTPDEFNEGRYDFATDVYFVGKLFEELISENKISMFKYANLLQYMVTESYIRFTSFKEILNAILNDEYQEIDFTTQDQAIYRRFIECLTSIISIIDKNAEYNDDADMIILRLELEIRNALLETNFQGNNKIINCFIKGNYRYYIKEEFSVSVAREFTNFFKRLSTQKKKIVLNHIGNRLDLIDKQEWIADDLPF